MSLVGEWMSYLFDKIVFHNSYGVGDLFESREFVKQIIKMFPDKEYFYAHKHNKRMFNDIENLTSVSVEELPRLSSKTALMINTWIGQNGLKYGCTVESNYQMYNDILGELGQLPGVPLDYLPTIDFTKFEIDGVNAFIKHADAKKVLICNGDVLSGQAMNFSFNRPIYLLASGHLDYSFIVTKRTPVNLPNVFYTEDITKTSDGFDINEISYLSIFCKVIVGRYSGPHTCTQVKENWFDPSKRLVTFTYREPGCSFTHSPEVKIKQFWSNAVDNVPVYNKIIEAIESR
jgi:hypothetical protein